MNVLEDDMKKPMTIICDIDGTLVVQNNDGEASQPNHEMELLPGTTEKLLKWQSQGHNLILLTGRRESMRKATETQLAKVNITYDHLIMGVGPRSRVLINDRRLNSADDTAFAINIKRDKGIKDIWV